MVYFGYFVEVPRPTPEFRAFPGRVALEGDVWSGSCVRDLFKVCPAKIALVRRDFSDGKPLRGRVEQLKEERVVVGVRVRDFNTGNNVGLAPIIKCALAHLCSRRVRPYFARASVTISPSMVTT